MIGAHESAREGTTLVLLAARPGDPADVTLADVPSADRVIAADSGLHLAHELGVSVDLVIGDFDSVDPDLLDRVHREGVPLQRHPRDKDHTDLALALAEAATTNPARIVVLGGAGGRLDHALANLHALADPALEDVEVRAVLGGAHVHVVRHRPVTLDASRGAVVSIVPVGGPATVTTDGLRWDLDREVLAATTSRGVSNELRATNATVTAWTGVVLAIQPAPEPPPAPAKRQPPT